MKAPGEWLSYIAQRACSDATMGRVVNPWLADFRYEFTTAVEAGRPWRARWIRSVYALAWSRVVVVGVARARGVGGAIGWQIGTFAALTALNIWPWVGIVSSNGGPKLLQLWYLVPQALTGSLLIAGALAVVFGLRGRPAAREIRAAILAVAIAGSVSMGVLDLWVLPRANQAFRVASIGREISKGVNEMTVGELRHFVATLDCQTCTYEAATRVAYQTRLMLPTMPFALVFGVLAIRGCRRRVVAASLGLIAAYWTYLSELRNWQAVVGASLLRAGLFVWMPTVLLFLGALAARSGSVREERAS